MIIQEERTIIVPAINTTDVFDFIDQLDSTHSNKINVIKDVRAEWGIGLKESKDLVEGVWEVCRLMECLKDAPWRGKTIEHIDPNREFIRNHAETVTNHDVAIANERGVV